MTESVLVVDDEEVVQNLIMDFLEEGGYKAYTASNGHDGLRELQDKQPDLVISDMRMPDMNGVEFFRLVRQSSNVPTVMITGAKPDDSAIRLGEGCVDAYMMKPISISALLSCVADLLRRS